MVIFSVRCLKLFLGKSRIVSSSSAGEYARILSDAVNRGRMVIIVGSFSVDYSGRASSTLGLGDRVLIIKRDKSVLIHQDKGVSPINWQPAGSSIFPIVRNGNLVVKAIRRSPYERLTLVFESIYTFEVLDLEDNSEFVLNASERQMQEAIMLKPEMLFKGFKPLSAEKRVEPGFIDVYGSDGEGNLVVVEIKRVVAGKNAVMQLKGYIDELKRRNPSKRIRGFIAAPGLSRDAEPLLRGFGFEFRRLDPYKCAKMINQVRSNLKLTRFF